MYKLRIHRTMLTVGSAWKRLEADIGAMQSVYQSFRVNAVVKRRMPIYGIQSRYSVRYLELTEDGKTQMILPVCKYYGTNDYCSVGQFNGYQVYDFIYSSEMTPEKMGQLFCRQIFPV